MEAAHLALAQTAYIPRAADLATTPMPSVDGGCGWCGIRLRALPDRPTLFAGRWYHPGGCLSAARLKHYSFVPESFRPWTEEV